MSKNDAGTGTDNGTTDGADSSDDPASQPASPPGNRAGGRGRGNPPGRSGSRRSVGSAADPRGDDGVNGPLTPGASADRNNTAGQGSQTDRQTAGRSVSR
ncbi:hypothetical protein, partial [Erwinia sp. ErVv1]|uniref:hypothetical protein n=1 Tax=Erwinia sp. ErVv1 TaxID=1603299 RepID=UPI0035164963